MKYLGDFGAGDTVYIGWRSSGQSGGSLNPTANGTVKIFKNGSQTERNTLAGVTDTLIFDSHDGLHLIAIDLSNNTDAGFYAAGSDYQVARVGLTVDGQTINEWLGQFSIDKRRALADVKKIDGSATAPIALRKLMDMGVLFGTVNDGAPTATAFDSTITLANDIPNGSVLIFLDGPLAFASRRIDDFANTNGRFSFAAGDGFPQAPANGNAFAVLGRN